MAADRASATIAAHARPLEARGAQILDGQGMDGWVAALSWRISLCDQERETRARAQACRMPVIHPSSLCWAY